MTRRTSPDGPLELEAMDANPPAGDSVATPAEAGPPTQPPEDLKVDAWLVAATREYQSGWIDGPLWAHLLAQNGGDEAQTKGAYLRARANMLHISKRDRHARRKARRAERAAAAESPAQDARPKTDGDAPARAKATLGVTPRTGVAIGILLVVAGVSLIARNRDPVAVPQAVIRQEASRPASAIPAKAGNPGPASADAVPAPKVKPVDDDYPTRIAKLRDADNWNMLVIHAAEWTRKEPLEATAWIELSVGYSKLRQFNEAFDAAKKAAAIAPADARVWRNLGQASLELDQPTEALQAFQKAVALNEQDVPSLVQVGLLSAHFAQLPQAKAALDKALQASPDDVGALCGQVLVARQQGRPKDAEAIAGKLQSAGHSCSDPYDSASVPVVAKQAPARKSVPSGTPRPSR